MSSVVSIQNITKTFDNARVVALNDVSFELEMGKILAVVGESGSGKTTLIRLITGLEVLDTGIIKLNDKVVSSDAIFINPEVRKVGMVFQDYALFPHMTVFKNIAYGLAASVDHKQRVQEVLDLVGLPDLAKRYPHELSGGQQQRIALARALAPKPELLILDEPFSNLDVILREQLRSEITRIIKTANTTAILVTHDIKDAMATSDEILVLQNGNIMQHGKTQEVAKNPNSEYVKLLLNFA